MAISGISRSVTASALQKAALGSPATSQTATSSASGGSGTGGSTSLLLNALADLTAVLQSYANASPGPILATSGPAPETLPITKDAQGGTAKVSNALSQIATDPEGQKLIQLAEQKGYKIEIGSTGEKAAATTDSKAKKIVVDINAKGLDSYNLTATIAHELVHASTDGNGDSLLEESLSTAVGNRIAKRADGRPETAAEATADFKKIYSDYKAAYKGDGAVNGRQDNGILKALQSLGLDVSPFAGVI